MKINPFFWKDYPIEIEKKEEYEEVPIINYSGNWGYIGFINDITKK